ncbi:hypothetical protein [Alteriqipengyuania lutimaris]|nr:hypothetical protein [Alteriqipengyuania lutimaris]MBB3033235.1 hypothetical protein [Alteriqipengyuania lutimaris]
MSSQVRYQFAEMYVAGAMTDAGWKIYLPYRDEGFDFIAMLGSGDETLIRPVQVKGLYPSEQKLKKGHYGFRQKLSALNPQMILALAFFPTDFSPFPQHIAWMPRAEIKTMSRGWHRCEPASFSADGPAPRRHFLPYFDGDGLSNAASPTFSVGLR